MANIPGAAVSPRLLNGTLYWYQGDTFDLELTISLTDSEGQPITIASTDTVKVVFTSRAGNIVKEFTFTNIQQNKVTLDFDATASALFAKGNYTYDIYYTGAERTTIANDCGVTVE